MLRFFRALKKRTIVSHSIRDYQAYVRKNLRQLPNNRSLALARAIGATSMDSFVTQGDGHVAVLRHHGLRDGMAVYDLGCGCGRTAQALKRSGWKGDYTGADVVPELLTELKLQCPDYQTKLNYELNILAKDCSLDMVFHWSVFTHLYPAECYAYVADSYRVLKPGGKLIFSFLELEDPAHDVVWNSNLAWLRKGKKAEQLDNFLHRDWIRRFAGNSGFNEPQFTDGFDNSEHPPFWQSLAILVKPS